MSIRVKASTLTDMPPGSMKGLRLGSREVLLANVDGTIYATQNRCPHLGWRLVKGTLDGVVVTCPGHGSQFDLSTGQVVQWSAKTPSVLAGLDRRLRPPRPLNTYPVRIEGDDILVQI